MELSHIISTLAQCVIGWLLVDRVPIWLNLNGVIAFIVRLIGVLVIIRAILSWV